MGYRVIDLFSGAGGLTLGFTDGRFCGGFESVWSLDIDKAAVATHRRNFGPHADCGDIEEWIASGKPIPQADVVIGGPPCQGFSLLNKQRIGDSRRALWLPFMEVVERSGASVFVIENVAELFRSDECGAIEKHAAKLGFAVVKDILLAANYGAPQSRRRTVIIGYKCDADAPLFPPLPTHAQPGTQSNLPVWKTVRDAIADLPQPVGTEIRDADTPLDLHFGRNPTAKSLQRYKAVPPGGNRFDLQRNAPDITPGCWIRKTSGGTDLFGRLWWDRPSVTIRTEFFKPEKGRYLHPDQHRPITHREAARLMGFPDDFEFVGTKIEIARQIGNAVPPPLAGAVAGVVLQILKAKLKAAA
ncbi:DNA cytosine methyltransferase [Sphingomonas sp. 2378]|uniref:DNA cytosine methyltransferase n=1 Tax=Sphingomonas sp. 2378 TaxID=1219748 RepID=UPI00311AD888